MLGTTVLGGKRREIRQLTGVRIIASMWVVVFHFQREIFGLVPEIAGLSPFVNAGYLAVDLFFVLSGFILSYQYLDKFASKATWDYPGFLWKRLARIYPVHAVVLVGLAALMIAKHAVGAPTVSPDVFGPPTFLMDLFLVRSWLGVIDAWNGPAWSLSAEWLAYILFPVIALFTLWVGRQKSNVAWVTLGVLVVAEGVATVLMPSADGMPHPVPRVLIAFTAGCISYLFARNASTTLRNGWLGGLAVLALLIVPSTLGADAARAVVGLMLAGLAIYFLATGSGGIVTAMGSRWMEYGGRISFSVYLVHMPTQLVLLRVLDIDRFDGLPIFVRAVLALLILVVPVVGGAAAYHLVERPAQKYMVSNYWRRSGRRTAETVG
jgi:peptidoglycan/LPS O-acetylase OafA/YrhL